MQGDNPPYGYTLENRRLVLGDEFEIEIIRRIFREYLAGKSVNGIVDRLNIARIPSPGGRTWYTSAVRKILRNIRYTGTFRWPDRIEGKYTTIDEVVVIENNHPAIIDKESFDMAQAKLDSRRKKKGETCHGPNPNYVLSGICRCTKCGSPMTGHTVNGKHYLICGGYDSKGRSFCDRNSVRQDKLLDLVIGAIEADYTNPDTIKRLRRAGERLAKQATSKTNSQRLMKKLATAQRKLEKAERNLALVDADMLPKLQATIRELDSEKSEIEQQLRIAETPVVDLAVKRQRQIDEAIELFSRLRESLSKFDPEMLREFLERAIDRIDVDVEAIQGKGRKRYRLKGGIAYVRNNALSNTSPRRTLP